MEWDILREIIQRIAGIINFVMFFKPFENVILLFLHKKSESKLGVSFLKAVVSHVNLFTAFQDVPELTNPKAGPRMELKLNL